MTEVKKVALYKYLKYSGFLSVDEATEYKEKDKDYVRVSEIVEVAFPDRVKEEIVQQAVKNLDKLESAARLELHRKLEEIAKTRADLLQLPFIPAVNTGITVESSDFDDDIPF